MHSASLGNLPSPVRANQTVKSALDGWKSARALLSSTVQSYSAACITLRAGCTLMSHRSPAAISMIEDALATIDSELDSLVSEAKSLLSVQISLATMRNNSAMLTRINTLPPEILASIFILSRNHRTRNDNFRFHDLASVCAYWRDIALNTPDLWTHVDISPSTPSGVTNLLLGRTKDNPIHIHVYEPKPPDNGYTPDYEILKTTNVLAPHMHRVCALDIESHSFSRDFIGAVLNLWFDRGSTSLSRSLTVYRPNGRQVLSPDRGIGNTILKSRSKHAKGVLLSLNTLHLQGVVFDWKSGAYRDLVDLRLDFASGGGNVPVLQFADMLRANPRLVILKLKSVHIVDVEDRRPPNPIVFRFLKVVNIAEMHSNSLKLLFPLLTLSDSPADFGASLHIYDEAQYDSQLRDFFLRSELTTLYWEHNGFSLDRWLSLYQPSPYLQTLILRQLDMEAASEAGAASPRSQTASSSYPPHVILLECWVTFGGLKTLISEYGIQNMCLERCTSIEEGGEDLHDIQTLLLQVYPELSCSISDRDSTIKLPYRTMFEH